MHHNKLPGNAKVPPNSKFLRPCSLSYAGNIGYLLVLIPAHLHKFPMLYSNCMFDLDNWPFRFIDSAESEGQFYVLEKSCNYLGKYTDTRGWPFRVFFLTDKESWLCAQLVTILDSRRRLQPGLPAGDRFILHVRSRSTEYSIFGTNWQTLQRDHLQKCAIFPPHLLQFCPHHGIYLH